MARSFGRDFTGGSDPEFDFFGELPNDGAEVTAPNKSELLHSIFRLASDEWVDRKPSV